MISTPLLVVILLAYVLFCGFIMYFCAIAHPEDSNMAYLLQVALPNKVWTQMSKVMGEESMDVVQSILDRGLVLIYLFVVLGCWTVVFWYVYPWISTSSQVSDVHKYVGYVVFLACFGSWRLTNKSSPGVIMVRSFKRFDHYPYDHLLFVPNQRCETTNLIRIPRSKFDRIKYNQNVPRYDHFCGWVFNTIGEENYRWFLLFLFVHVMMCAYGSSICIMLFYGEILDKKLMELTFFDRATGNSVRSNWFIVSQYLFSRRTFEFAALAVMFVMGIALGGFLSFHLYLTSTNQTTNENGKWTDVKKWYKSEQKRYQDAVKKGLVKPSNTKLASRNGGPTVQDGDVNCTGGSNDENQEHQPQEQEDEEFVDPGPTPRNIYDRGFIENWKEVLFPLSRRKEALELGGYSRPRPKPTAKSKPRQAQPVVSNKDE